LLSQARAEALKRGPLVGDVGEDITSVLAEKPCPRDLQLEAKRGESLALVAVEALFVPDLGIVPEQHPEVRRILAGCRVLPVAPRPRLQEGDGRQRGHMSDDVTRQPNHNRSGQGLGQARDVHDLVALRPFDAPIGSLDAAEGNDVEALSPEPETMGRSLGGEARPDEAFAKTEERVPAR